MCATPYFQQAVAQHVEAYQSFFRERLIAVYVWGSVHRDEAVAEMSDLDLHAFITDSCSIDECAILRQRYPHLSWLTPPLPVNLIHKGLQADAGEASHILTQAFYVRLRYDATLAWGTPLFSDVEDMEPNRDFAKACFASVRDCLRYAVGLDSENKSDFSLPIKPHLRLRKLARLAVLGGGYLLIAQNEFHSFKGKDILPMLKHQLPQWRRFLSETERLYITLTTTNSEAAIYEQQTVKWIEWLNEQFASN